MNFLPWQQLRYGPHVGDLHVVAETCSSPHLAESLFPPAEGAHSCSCFWAQISCWGPWASPSPQQGDSLPGVLWVMCRPSTWWWKNPVQLMGLPSVCHSSGRVGRAFWVSLLQILSLFPVPLRHRQLKPPLPHAAAVLPCLPAPLPAPCHLSFAVEWLFRRP